MCSAHLKRSSTTFYPCMPQFFLVHKCMAGSFSSAPSPCQPKPKHVHLSVHSHTSAWILCTWRSRLVEGIDNQPWIGFCRTALFLSHFQPPHASDLGGHAKADCCRAHQLTTHSNCEIVHTHGKKHEIETGAVCNSRPCVWHQWGSEINGS